MNRQRQNQITKKVPPLAHLEGQPKIPGLSLIEFLVIGFIIVVLIGISVSVLMSYQPDLQLNGATRNLVSDFRYTQQLTVVEQVVHGIHFYPSEKRYEIKKFGTETSIIRQVNLPDEITTLTIDETIINNNNEVKYNPYGAVDVTGNITLENIRNHTRVIEVAPSGFVRIID